MATFMSDFVKAVIYSALIKFEEFRVDVFNKILELLLTPVK